MEAKKSEAPNTVQERGQDHDRGFKERVHGGMVGPG